MQKRIYQSMFFLMLVAVLMASAVGTTTVYADDGDPASPNTETVASDESTPTDTTTEEVISVPEILEQLPADTELVVLNEASDIEPLVTEIAAEILTTADPMWCPDGATPGDADCTSSFADFATLIDALKADALLAVPLYTGNGVIWVADSYAGNDDAQIVFDGSTLSTLSNLTIQGGWSGNNDTNISGTSQTDVSMIFVNWNGNITLNDMDIAAADEAGFGLSVDNTGDVTLNNVSVSNTTLSAAFDTGDGAILNSTGNVDIINSNFDNNAGNGLQVKTSGTIDLDTVSASGNDLTGAYLDSCLYESVAPGLCAGIGAVTITSDTTNLFNDNGFNGLVVDSGGDINLDHLDANNNDLNGAILTSSDDNGAGNVSVDQSNFNDNANGTGVNIYTSGNIDLTNVDANTNGTGSILDTTSGMGEINVTDSNFTDNTWTGLHAESGSTIDLDTVDASNNGTNGAYLEAQGDITVTDSTFNDNVHFNFPQDPGLYAKSNGGDIDLTNVIANGNDYGAGAVLITNKDGLINVTGGQFNQNGTFGVQAQTENGDLTLDGITASQNKDKGAYLSSYGLGNIFITDSDFVENGSYGIYASASEGDINLDLVTVTGDNGVNDGAPEADNLTDYGAVLMTYNGGNILVNDSSFNLNTETGLYIVGSGKVDLINVTTDQNGGNGVEVYSTYTDGPVCPGEQVVNIAVNVDGGTFTNNGGYGLMAKPGPLGTLDFSISNPSTFGGNGLGDFLLDLSEPSASTDCDPKDEPTDPKKPKTVDVPYNGGEPVEQNCEEFSSTILKLPNGTWVNVGCPFEGFSKLKEVLKGNLPGKLGAGTDFVSAVDVSLTDKDGNTILNENGTVTLNFKLPENSRGRGYSIMFWDETLNDGAGGWVEMPLYEAGTSFPLNPENPDDGRIINSGVQQVGDMLTITVNFPGVFVLVAR